MAELLNRAGERVRADQIWVNPDCGLKTRSWDEVRPALVNMVFLALSPATDAIASASRFWPIATARAGALSKVMDTPQF